MPCAIEHDRRMRWAREAAAQAWCTETTSGLPMDEDLAEAFADILVVHMYEPHLGFATTGELLASIMARVDCDYKALPEKEK